MFAVLLIILFYIQAIDKFYRTFQGISGADLETKISKALYGEVLFIESFIDILLITRSIVWLCWPLNPPLYSNHLGTPPDCELCHSPCYDNWQKYIENEAHDISNMQKNITNLLSKFGGMTYEHIETQLSWLDGNLSTAINVFSGARYNTSVKEQQFRKVNIGVTVSVMLFELLWNSKVI